MDKNTQAQKQIILQQALRLLPIHGWSPQLLEQASHIAGFQNNYGELLFIGGISELISLYFSYTDSLMNTALDSVDTSNLGVSDKIKIALKTRMMILAKNRGAVARTVSYLSLPWNVGLGFSLGWRTMDLIWSDFIGDASTDFNYYTKRTLLYAVYVTSVQYMLSDNSQDLKDTYDFIDRKIDDVLNIGKFISNFK